MLMNKSFDEQTIEMLKNDSKIGILMTSDENNTPHLTLISSIQARGENEVTFGEFCVGLSKQFIKERPYVAFMALDASYKYVRGTARFTHFEKGGEAFDEYNNKPLFRYNSYFGFNTIYYMDLLGTSGLKSLEMPKIVAGAVASRVKAPFAAKSDKNILNHVAQELFTKLDGLKFIGYFDENGSPWIIPIIQATHAGTDRVAFSAMPFGDELKKIPVGSKVAVLALNMQLQGVLVKGTYSEKGVVDIERVYNTMPPKMEYVYPRAEMPAAVTEFE